jgi:hypothetical protein
MITDGYQSMVKERLQDCTGVIRFEMYKVMVNALKANKGVINDLCSSLGITKEDIEDHIMSALQDGDKESHLMALELSLDYLQAIENPKKTGEKEKLKIFVNLLVVKCLTACMTGEIVTCIKALDIISYIKTNHSDAISEKIESLIK